MPQDEGTRGVDGEGPALSRPRLRAWLAEFRSELGDLVVHVVMHWRLVLGLGVAALVAALLFAWSGVYSVAASTGHYPFFRTFLGFALEQSVRTHSIGITAPALDDPGMIRRGAGHYQGGCAPCHGAPSQARNPITRRMLPEPPYLPDVVARWTSAEQFWIVRHGIKYAGMPAWVALGREDEVWSVVAFLRRLPDMDAPTYRQLAFGPAAGATEDASEGLRLLLLNGPVGNAVAACARCHGATGAAQDDAFPRLDLQTAPYLYEALQAYALGARPSGIMQPVAAELNQAEMRLLADHYAGQPQDGAVRAQTASAEVLELGRRIALKGVPERGVAACASCHGPKAGGMPALYPRLEGQHAWYVAQQLRLWLRGVRGGEREKPLARVMARAVGMDPDDPPAEPPLDNAAIEAVAAWYASLPPASRSAVAATR
ncbi:cytochrome C [Falsiroseomonas bella]|uniref:Cytochrome C n=1 Tax=Falsiroseomonas bella TaxID=2184016 RepID=A0A317FDA9_9PROT|nr:c-type cytochrome [Falsiroseomonas bella]PWS37074.1 cytochrome C [Falsiroseomonas bella]